MAVDGSWNITFVHPSGNQNLKMVLATADGSVTGSVTNPQLGITVPIAEGMVDGDKVTFRAPMEKPIAVDLTVKGSVDGDTFTGEVTVGGGGTFPFSGTRV